MQMVEALERKVDVLSYDSLSPLIREQVPREQVIVI
jgi:predicted nucleotidyltransferase